MFRIPHSENFINYNQTVCTYLLCVGNERALGMKLRGREDSVLHENSFTQCLFFPRFQILVLFLYFSTEGGRSGGGGEQDEDETRK